MMNKYGYHGIIINILFVMWRGLVDRIDAMKAFVAVVTEGSFTKAADKLGISTQLISKYVSQFEAHLGVRLLNRTTRKVHPTEAGEQCVEHAKQILERVQDMEGHFGQLQVEAQGLLRISGPVSFSTLHLAPLIHDFKKAYPAVGIDLQLSDRKIDVIEDGFDVALRIGHLKSSSLIVKKIASVRLVLCASPDYLQKNGTPLHPNQLISDDYLRYSYMEFGPSNQPLMEALRLNAQKQDSHFVANNGEVLMAAAIAGAGYIYQPTFIVGDALRAGKLTLILQEFEPSPIGLYAVFPHRKLIAPKLRSFIDFISRYYGDPPYWDNF